MRAVFLDRDGVLVRDDGGAEPGPMLPGAAPALARLRAAGFELIVATNQTAIARGLVTEAQVDAAHERLAAAFAREGAAPDAFYVCPHHPRADVPAYRCDCACRKPRPGLLLRAAAERGIELGASVLVGDRVSDIAAGARAGCRTVLVTTGAHDAPPIESPDAIDPALRADHVCANLAAAADWILEARCAR